MEKNHFRVDIDIKEQKIYVSLTTDKYNNTNIIYDFIFTKTHCKKYIQKKET